MKKAFCLFSAYLSLIGSFSMVSSKGRNPFYLEKELALEKGEDEISLLGITVGEKGGTVLLKKGDATQVFRRGETAWEYKVASIGDRTVTLLAHTKEIVLVL